MIRGKTILNQTPKKGTKIGKGTSKKRRRRRRRRRRTEKEEGEKKKNTQKDEAEYKDLIKKTCTE